MYVTHARVGDGRLARVVRGVDSSVRAGTTESLDLPY